METIIIGIKLALGLSIGKMLWDFVCELAFHIMHKVFEKVCNELEVQPNLTYKQTEQIKILRRVFRISGKKNSNEFHADRTVGFKY